MSYPLRYGVYSEIETAQATLHFNRNREIIRLIGKTPSWPHSQEWLKRTAGNDWIYYSTGGYAGVVETTGEYYLPNLPYPTNKHTGGTPFEHEAVAAQLRSWWPLLESVREQAARLSDEHRAFIEEVCVNTPATLREKAAELRRICRGRTSVLPPDTRHVDYQVVPLPVSTGCLHKCGFCRVKNKKPFAQLDRAGIDDRVESLRRLYHDDLSNYNAVFLGEHDALAVEPDLLCYAIARALDGLGLQRSYMRGSAVFLFGSVTSLRAAPDRLFARLARFPCRIYINIGLESADQTTLETLGKPLTRDDVASAFNRMQEINDAWGGIEMTANFVTGGTLAQAHYDNLLELVRHRVSRPRSKGAVYLSPLELDAPSRAKLFDFYRLKRLSRLPLFMYTIQRL